ncbi:hypothetical protein [Legionella bononiensis]|uniref:Dot/Icm T4SS effector n=1 Tax=Legionella bononiensis TaxID=2793102 RepID=A0ABS1WFV0_9GAMM|nr:hypothetical protein [Legionella bononiensis]MBL7481603.1 hypothetical protein [Legionella bononiensis]MBL7528150.1 hypothetical protein [Legionella bononiensis]MBL7562626.1 hypothetical protein [Legionella bononiensis]
MNELLTFLIEHLSERDSFKRIREIASVLIQQEIPQTEDQKREHIISSLEEIESRRDIAIEKKKVILATLEVILLSKRISDFRETYCLTQRVKGNNNHSWTLQGAEMVISTRHPDIPVHYATYTHKGMDNVVFDAIINALKTNKGIWFVLGYDTSLHLTLLRLEFSETGILEVKILDSLGIIPSKSAGSGSLHSNLLTFIKFILLHFDQKLYTMTGYPYPRQKDGVNCFSFVLSDLETGQKLLDDGHLSAEFFNDSCEDLYPSDEPNIKYRKFRPHFFKISQFLEDVPEEEQSLAIMPVSSRKSKVGNQLALRQSITALVTLARSGTIVFTAAHYTHEDKSEEDIENNCVIM